MLWEAAIRGTDAHRTQKYLHLDEQVILFPFYVSVSPTGRHLLHKTF